MLYGSFTPGCVTDICLNTCLIWTTLSAVCGMWAKEVCLMLQRWFLCAIALYSVTGYLLLDSHTILFIYNIAEHWAGQWLLFLSVIIMIFLLAHKAAVIYLHFWKQSFPKTVLATTNGDKELLFCKGCIKDLTAIAHGFLHLCNW